MKLLLLFLMAPLLAHADPVSNMRGWCDCVMAGDVCRVTNGPAKKPGARVFSSSGLVVDANVYNAFKEDPLMCQHGEQACRKDWNSKQCVFFRDSFRQEPMTCVRPGEVRLGR